MRREDLEANSAGPLGGLFHEWEPDPSRSLELEEADRKRARLEERRQRAAQAQALERLKQDGAFLAERFKLRLRSIDAESRRVKRRYGICYDDGTIKIRLHNVRTGDVLKYSALVDTLCHELAHLRHFNHGPRFQIFYRKLLEYARRNSIYKPEPRRSARPLAQRPLPPLPPRRPTQSRGSEQLELF